MAGHTFERKQKTNVISTLNSGSDGFNSHWTEIRDYKDFNETGHGQFTTDEANMINKKVGICI